MQSQEDLHPRHWMSSEDVDSEGSKYEHLHIPTSIEAGIACEKFMSAQFNNSYPLTFSNLPSLRNYVAYALQRTEYDINGMITPTLILIQRYRLACPKKHLLEREYHRLFLVALIIAAKFLLDDVYPNKSWEEVSRGGRLGFSMMELNQTESDVCKRLGWGLTFEREELRQFHSRMFPWPKSGAGVSNPNNGYPWPQATVPAAYRPVHAPARERSIPPPATRHQYIAAPGPLPHNTQNYTQPRPRTLSHSQGGIYTPNYTLNTARPADHFPYDTRPNVPSTHTNRDPLPRMFSDTYISKPAVRHYNPEVYHPTIEEMRLARRRPRTPPLRRRLIRATKLHTGRNRWLETPIQSQSEEGRGRALLHIIHLRLLPTIQLWLKIEDEDVKGIERLPPSRRPRSSSVAYNGYTSEAENREHKSSKRGRSKSRHKKTREKESSAYSDTGSKIYDWHTGRELLPPKKEKKSSRRERERSSSRAPPRYY
ncbi:hypothetical protein VNI00_014084 [Paramarasmius palmivorus]|uniref:Cyclin N-terminal domain-containing protein n=1 Tax=Paramarasmius palmivorus TaxID=297713 RepID=A0AAW0BUF4_9AGAR